jgi:hypothetical protein
LSFFFLSLLFERWKSCLIGLRCVCSEKKIPIMQTIHNLQLGSIIEIEKCIFLEFGRLINKRWFSFDSFTSKKNSILRSFYKFFYLLGLFNSFCHSWSLKQLILNLHNSRENWIATEIQDYIVLVISCCENCQKHKKKIKNYIKKIRN